MKEPSRDKPFALMFTFFRIGGKMDWSKEILVRVYRYKPEHRGISEHWEFDERGHLEPHEKFFGSMEEAIMNFSVLGIDLYKIKECSNKYFQTPKNVYFTHEFGNFVSPATTLKRLEKIRGR